MENLTSIQINRTTREKLLKFKDYGRETYDEILNKMIKIMEALDKQPELKEEIIEEVEEARREIKEGKGISTKQLLKKLMY